MNIFDKTIREKKSTADSLLEQKYVMLHIDPRALGVHVPEHLTDSPTLTLQISRHFRGAMELEKDRVTADLLFDGSYFNCEIPYTSIWAMTSEQGEMRLWPESMPPELHQGTEPVVSKAEGKLDSELESSSTDGEEESDNSIVSDPPQKRMGHLTRVK